MAISGDLEWKLKRHCLHGGKPRCPFDLVARLASYPVTSHNVRKKSRGQDNNKISNKHDTKLADRKLLLAKPNISDRKQSSVLKKIVVFFVKFLRI